MKERVTICILISSVLTLVFGYECERDKCRTVRDVVYKEMYPLFQEHKLEVPPECPFNRNRDLYLFQEEHKERESLTRWSCNFCGKAFIGELYLDEHFNNRHSDTVYRGDDSVCLGDYCEVFRCDVLAGSATANFWDVVLCMEEDMIDLKQDCRETLNACIPDTVHWNISNMIKASLDEKICSYLTCNRYWDAPSLEDLEPPGSGYIVFSILLGVSLILYYCIAINYFFLDTFSDPYDFDDVKNPQSISRTEEIRIQGYPKSSRGKSKSPSSGSSRTIQSEAQEPDSIFNLQRIGSVDIQSQIEVESLH